MFSIRSRLSGVLIIWFNINLLSCFALKSNNRDIYLEIFRRFSTVYDDEKKRFDGNIHHVCKMIQVRELRETLEEFKPKPYSNSGTYLI